MKNATLPNVQTPACQRIPDDLSQHIFNYNAAPDYFSRPYLFVVHFVELNPRQPLNYGDRAPRQPAIYHSGKSRQIIYKHHALLKGK